MCGIFALLNSVDISTTSCLKAGTEIIHHRGPDDEGYLLWNPGTFPNVYAGTNTANASKRDKQLLPLPTEQKWKVGLGHRRLSILDLSSAGHQPMVHQESGISITYNGEIYNYLEIRKELELKGYKFNSKTDTEVLLLSWVEWGHECLNRLNGMFSFVVLDPAAGKLYAVRDRFGVKPLYWTKTASYIAFCSEIKQLRALPEYKFDLNKTIAIDYLAYGILDHTENTFDTNIFQLRGGQIAEVAINDPSPKVNVTYWYQLKAKKWMGTDKDAINRFEELFTDSIRLRLRSDVPVGSCLSGGLDSSSIVCIMSQLLKNELHKGLITITSCFEEKRFDEWEYAKAVVEQTEAKSYKTFPTVERLQDELDKLIWHMDEPFGSSSQFSQWSVFAEAARAGLKVMLDGQGADEQLAGYGGNDEPLYSGLLKEWSWLPLLNEWKSYKNANGYLPKAQIIGAFHRAYPGFLPKYFKKFSRRGFFPDWLHMPDKSYRFPLPASTSLQESMIQQTLSSSLPALLRYEDRNSMAFSIESRVPFLDYRFVEFTLGLPEHLVYKNGLRKVILRKAMQKTLPEKVNQRRDKMGFVTPEESWLKETAKDWFYNNIMQAVTENPDIFNESLIKTMTQDIVKGKSSFNFTLWRILCFGRWIKSLK